MNAEHIEAIRHTMAAYNIAGDRMRIDALAATFTNDGVLETPNARWEGRHAIAAGLGRRAPADQAPQEQPSARRPSFVRHNLTTSLIELTGPDAAEGRSYFQVLTDIGADHAGCYVDRFRRTDEGWRIAHRRVLIDWMSPDSLFEALKAAHVARLAGKATQPVRP